MKQFMDIFSIPEMTLLAVANDYFITNDIEYDPVHLFKDVSVSEPPILTETNVTPFFLGCVSGVFLFFSSWMLRNLLSSVKFHLYSCG